MTVGGADYFKEPCHLKKIQMNIQRIATLILFISLFYPETSGQAQWTNHNRKKTITDRTDRYFKSTSKHLLDKIE